MARPWAFLMVGPLVALLANGDLVATSLQWMGSGGNALWSNSGNWAPIQIPAAVTQTLCQ